MADEDEMETSRRSFLKLMGASTALAGFGMAACRRPESYIVPYTKAPEWVIPGKATYYASGDAARPRCHAAGGDHLRRPPDQARAEPPPPGCRRHGRLRPGLGARPLLALPLAEDPQPRQTRKRAEFWTPPSRNRRRQGPRKSVSSSVPMTARPATALPRSWPRNSRREVLSIRSAHRRGLQGPRRRGGWSRISPRRTASWRSTAISPAPIPGAGDPFFDRRKPEGKGYEGQAGRLENEPPLRRGGRVFADRRHGGPPPARRTQPGAAVAATDRPRTRA
jgi:hypothetical protein